MINETLARGRSVAARSNRDASKRVRINREIRAPEVRLIGQQSEQLGVVSIAEAVRLTEEMGLQLQIRLDLVEIAPNADPPVCQMMDYSKYLFELNKKKVAQKKKQKRIKVKEVKFRPVTDKNDYAVKLRNLIGFLEEGDKVKVSIRFRGREIEHQELGRSLMQRLEADLASYASIELAVKMEARQMIMVVAPKKKIK